MAQSEIGAIAAENVLGYEYFIKKLLRKDTNFAQKVFSRIMDMKDAFASHQIQRGKSGLCLPLKNREVILEDY